MSDGYRELVEALRGAVVEAEDGGEATRQRIMRDLAAPKRPRRTRLVLALIAAGFALSSAFALYRATLSQQAPATAAPAEKAANGPPLVDREQREVEARGSARAQGLATTPSPQAAALPDNAAVRSAARLASPKRAAKRAPPTRDTQVSLPSPGPPLRDAPAAGALGDDPANPPPAQLGEAQQRALYISAHRLQFRGAPQRALEAWDAYLASSPSGPLLREALYNRGVILVRLGRRADAEHALGPFARGEHGGFRQAEARQLLRGLTLSHEAAGPARR